MLNIISIERLFERNSLSAFLIILKFGFVNCVANIVKKIYAVVIWNKKVAFARFVIILKLLQDF